MLFIGKSESLCTAFSKNFKKSDFINIIFLKIIP